MQSCFQIRSDIYGVTGKTKSLVSVSGPIEARLASESPSQATLDIHVRPLVANPGTDAKALAAILKTVLTPSILLSQHPRTLIQIVGQAFSGNESGSGMGSVGRGWNTSLIATLINATTTSLLSAGSIPMKGVVCAVAVGRFPRGETNTIRLALDPSESELASLTGSGCFAFLFTTLSDNATSPPTDGPSCALIWSNYGSSSGTSFDQEELATAKQLAEVGATAVWHRLKQSVADLESSVTTSIPVHIKKEKEKALRESVPTEIDDEKMEI
ncbi:hypothetical protein EUX98_g3574 [Antrodiella citrinella]|uniref:Exoribonuclease phosphorolytic domain-containing protein n=1 Tax=Antrodiella citrinella TaxID=2447956 RepID=A0A4V3XIV6_9APHY|nr:hypothetical protein EUX98_g3574 [Antrodiella citrinella]